MPTTRSQAPLLTVLQATKRHNAVQHIIALPQPLLELILIPYTSTKDKKTLRETCKSFQKMLDGCITSVRLGAYNIKSRQCIKQLLIRMQHIRSLEAVYLSAFCDFSNILNSFLRCLPKHITSLRVCGDEVSLKALGKLPNLTYLDVARVTGKVTGLEYVSGVTRLHCYRPVVQVAHLAPTLKHFSTWAVSNVVGLAQLTNLEVLEAVGGLPPTFFQTHGQLPLKHLQIVPTYSNNVYNDLQFWHAAPKTLSRLTMDVACDFTPGVLPTTITHLQLHQMPGTWNMVTEQAAAALPLLNRLDLSATLCESQVHMWNSARMHLSRLHSLESLGLCVKIRSNGVGEFSTRAHLLSVFPDIATAVERGVKLNVMEGDDERYQVFGYPYGYPYDIMSEWAILS